MRTGSTRDRVLSGARRPRVFLASVLFVILGLVLLACGAPSPAPETAVPTRVVSSRGRAAVAETSVQATTTAAVISTLPSPTPAGHELSPIATPTSTGRVVSPLPTPTEPPAPTAKGKEVSPLPTATSTSHGVSPIPSPTVSAEAGGEAIPIYTYRVVQAFPHDPAAWTQGLVFEDGVFYEGTGLHEHSTLRRVDPETGTVLQQHDLPPDLFGEGITIWKDRIIQLTWREGVGLVYDKESFELLDRFRYPTEGWGITHDGARLIMSDGTSTLHFWDPETFEEVGWVEVIDQAGPVTWLNELEYIEGLVYANVYQTDRIAMIEPETGQVTGWIDLSGILGYEIPNGSGDVLNGIAYSEPDGRLFVTGKRWPLLFEIELVPLQGED